MHLGRSRLREYYQRILREDMLTLFNCTARLTTLECSIVLHGAQTMSDEFKYRAACLLELLTGQAASARDCNVLTEDPAQRAASDEQRRDLERARGAFIQQAMQGTRKGPKPDPAVLGQQIKKLGSGVKVLSHLRNVKMYYFLEKLREFYLPDVVGRGEHDDAARVGWRPKAQGHDNSLQTRGLILQYQKAGGSKRSCYPSRYPLRRQDNLDSAISCYTLRSSDLLKFPDVELHFEALGPILGAREEGQAVQLIIRPSIDIDEGVRSSDRSKIPPVETLRVMNYLLSQYFNAYMSRPLIG